MLYLITHAHTQVVPMQNAATWQLSPTGVRQAEALAELPCWASIDLIIVSSERKTVLTVAPLLARHRLPVVVDSRLDEVQRPGWVEAYAEHVQAFFAAPEQSVGGWESAEDALRRFLAGVTFHMASGSGEPVALVSHGLVLSLFRAHLLGSWPPDFAAWRRLGFAAVAKVDWQRMTLIEDFSQTDSGRGG